MPRNDAAAPVHDCPGIGVHIIDIVQPPGISIPPIADMEPDQTIVTAALAAKSSAEPARKARSEARSAPISVISKAGGGGATGTAPPSVSPRICRDGASS